MADQQNDSENCCAICGQPLDEREIDICRQRAEQFDNQWLCFAHQRRFCGCPGLRNQQIP